HDAAALPHLFRMLWLFWFMADYMDQIRSWVDRLLPSADSLPPESRAELVWTATVVALEVGDDAMALAAGERLRPLLVDIHDPFPHAVCPPAIAWTLPIVGAEGGAPREAPRAPAELPPHDQPLSTG